MARGTRPYISAKEREIIKTNAKQAAQDPKIKYRSKIERALEEKENREKRQELRTFNGRQVGLSSADSMEQATRSVDDYMKWAQHEYGDLKPMQQRRLRSVGAQLAEMRQAREAEAARQQAIKDARARRLDPNNWKTTYAVEPEERGINRPKQNKKQFFDEQVQAKRNWESYLQGIGYKGYEGFKRYVKENGGTPTVDLWKKWNQMNVQNGKEGGMDYDYNPRYVSDEGLDSWQARQQGKANQAYNSAEKIAQDFEQSRPANAWGSVLDLLDEQKGLKANRPADYNKYREEYDEALYDSLNGKGAYEQRIDALQTDDDVLVLESELDALWDKMTPAEISRFDEGEALRMSNEANKRRQDSTAQADDFFRYEYDPEYWGMEATPEEQRAALFDRIMGEGDSYEARTSTMTPEEKAELDRRLDAVLQSANETRNDTWDVHAADVATDLKTGDAYNSLVKKGQQEKEYRETVKDYGAKAAEMQAQGYTGEYNAELVPRNEWVTDEEDTEGMVRHIDERSEIDKAYDIINGHGDARLNKNAIGMASKYDFLSDSPENNQKEQFNIFYAYDKENGTHLAEQYLAGLDAYLTNCLSEWQDFQARSIGEEPIRGPILRVASYPAKVATGLIGAAGTVAALLGDKSAQDPTSDWYALDKFQNSLRDQQNEIIDKALGGNGTGKFLMGVVDSIADNIFAMGTGKALSPDNLDRSMRLVQMIMSGSATSSKMVEMLNNGRSATEAALYAIGDGAIEWITEKFSLENLLRPDIKQMLGNKKQMAAFIAKNIAAEGSEEIASDLLNLALDDILSTVFRHESEMLEQYNQLVASGMGDKEASRKVLMDKIHDVGMSGLAGALSGGFMSGGRMGLNAITQRNIGANVKQSKNMNELLDVALKMDQGTQSRSMAEELVEKKHAGNKPTNVQLGKLSQLMIEESREDENQGRATVTKVANLMEGRTAEGLDKRAVGQHLATEDDIRRAEGNRTGGAGEVIVGGRFAQVTGMERVTGEDGKSSWKIRVEENGKIRYVNQNEVKATNFATAAVLRQRAVNPEFYGGNYTNTLLKQVADGVVENIGQHLQDGYKIRWAAYLGQQMPQTSMNQQAAEELYLQSRQDAAQEWQEAQKDRQANFRGQGKGVVRLNGMEYGSDGFNAAVQQLDQQQRDRIELVANIAQASGFELDFFDANDADYKANVHGWENSKGITINLDSYDSRQAQAEGRKHHIVATLSHEMTHWLQRNNPKGYLQLQDFVLQKMADEGVNLAARAQDLMAQRGIGMTEAIDEIVANACDQVLGNQALADELKQNNKGLYNSIKNFVKNIVDKIKSAVFGMEKSASLDARRIMYKYGNELSKIWLGAYDEVLSGKIAEMEAQATKESAAEKRFSKALNEIGLEQINQEHVDNILARGDVIANTENEFIEFINKARKDTSYKQSVFIGAISEDTKELLEKDTGMDNVFKNGQYVFGIRADDIRHTYKHFENETDVAQAVFDVCSMLIDHDSAEGSIGKTGQTIITLKKGNNSIEITAVTEYSNKKRAATVKTVYLSKGNIKNWRTLNRAATLGSLRRSSRSPLLNKNISQNEEKDKRFSMSDVVEEREDGLIAVHNLGADQMLKVLQLGGFAMPSIAIVRTNYAHNRYGDISVVFGPDTIDPKAYRTNKVYSGDAWTPTYPSVEYKINSKTVNRVLKTIDQLVPEEMRQNNADLYVDNLQKEVNSSRGNIVEAVKRNKNLQLAYLFDKGIKPDIKQREKQLSSNATNEQIKKVVDALGEDVINAAYETGYQYLEEHPEVEETIRNILNADREAELRSKIQDEEKIQKVLEMLLYTKDNWSYGKTDNILGAAYRYLKYGIKTETDTASLNEQLEKNIDQEGYEKWLAELFSGAIEKSGIRNNKNYYTDYGNPRSWEQLHDEETLENVVRVMRAELDKGSNAFFGQNSMLALGTRDFKSLKEIRESKGQLQHLTKEEISAAKSNIIHQFGQLMDEMADPKERNVFIARDRVLEAMVDAVRSSRTVSGIEKVMNEWGYKPSAEQVQTIIDLMKEIGNLPTEYFEAKPKRAVGIDEIKKVILPEGTDQKLLDELERWGVDYETYNGTDEDRLAKMNDVEGARFSIADDSSMEVAAWMEHVSPWSLQTEGERQLLSDYRGKRVALQLSIKRQDEYEKQIRTLEQKGELAPAERQKLAELRNKLDVQQGKQVRLLNELYQITGSEGYAGMMYRNQKLLDDFVQGKTAEQVTDTISDLMQKAEKAAQQIKRRQGEIEQMAENGAIKAVIRALNNRGLIRTVQALQKEYVTAMGSKELKGRLAEIILKKVNNEDIAQDIKDLAQDVVSRQQSRAAEDANSALKQLRGMTVKIGPTELKQMQDSDIKLIDQIASIKGSGVKLKAVDSDSDSTMLHNTDEMSRQVPGIADKINGSETDVQVLVDYIRGLLDMRETDKNEYGIDLGEVEAFLQASVNIVLNDETGGLTPEKLQRKIKKREGVMDKALAGAKLAAKTADELLAGTKKADGFAGFLHHDVEAAIDYYNKVAKQAAEVERNNVRKNVIEVLRNEHTKALIEQQQKYLDMMKNDRKAREIHQDNEVLRSKMDTELKRFRTLLTAETDKKNIQEEAKPLARQITNMLAEHDRSGLRKVTYMAREKLDDFAYRLSKMQGTDGRFDPDTELDWLVIKAPNAEDNDTSLKERAISDLADIEKGLMEYQLAERQGPDDKRTGAEILQARKDALLKIQEAVEELSEMIRARSEAFINGQRHKVMDLAVQMQKDMEGSRFKGERTGKLGKAANAVGNYIGYGNETPVYFIKNLKNRTMSLLAGGAYAAENESGLQALAAQKAIDRIVQETGFEKWDGQEKHQVKVSGGRTIEMTTEQIMALYATWVRESNALRPEDTAHLLHGGFVLNKGDTSKGLYGREKAEARPIRMTQELLDGLESYLTAEQKDYVDRIVAYMSGELAEIGNRASLQTFGIRKFTEQYYFPIKSWGGVLNKSSTSGVNSNNDNAAMRQSFTKRVMANAQNAIEIGDFTATAMKHIVGMIRFNTVGPAVENLNKVLNQQLEYGTKEYGEDGAVIDDDTYKRNMRALFEENYGKNAYNYLTRWMQDMNGGVTQAKDDSMYGRLLSVFRKGAVAGSLSVAAQQPLSYIRAAMMVNPKYLAAAAAPWNWGKVHAEMLKYSGVAVIKDMGKFDMNQGRSMVDFISPEAKQSRAKAAAAKVTDWSTKAPEIMDQVTWGRMWVACKLETAAKNPGMDRTSDAFMKKVAERFNDLMRMTQVYDSVMVRSQNMRSTNVANKMMTSFMAEPTLTLNVLADAVKNVGEKGGKLRLAKAVATFIMSAAAQAAVKGIMAAGRSPDEKKTLEEQFYTKWIQNFLSEANPMNLVPGLSEIVEALKQGDVSNDAMSVLGKLKTINEALGSWTTGKTPFGHRTLEDTIGQVMQIFTGVPLKNIMRDGRAMYNFFAPGKYAKRDSSGAVIKYGVVDSVLGGNNMAGLLNELLQKNGIGYGTSTADYAKRIYNANKAGNEQAENELREYYILGKSKSDDPAKALRTQLNSLAKDDESISAEQKLEKLAEGKYGSLSKEIADDFKAGKIDRKTAEKLYKENFPDKTEKAVISKFDALQWEKDGKPLNTNAKEYSDYTPVMVGIENNKAEEIRSAVEHMKALGYEPKKIKETITSNTKKLYLATNDKEQRRRLRDALQKAYKVLGYTADDVDKAIEKWLKEKKKE